MGTTELIFIILLSIASLCFYIWMIILYIKLCKDVSFIKDIINNEVKNKSISQVSLKDIKLAILTHKQDEVYEKLVSTTYKYLYKCCYVDKSGNVQINNNQPQTQINNSIKRASSFCKKLGKELPDELSSLEKFIQFFNH